MSMHFSHMLFYRTTLCNVSSFNQHRIQYLNRIYGNITNNCEIQI